MTLDHACVIYIFGVYPL